jgi:hypothetical protein
LSWLANPRAPLLPMSCRLKVYIYHNQLYVYFKVQVPSGLYDENPVRIAIPAKSILFNPFKIITNRTRHIHRKIFQRPLPSREGSRGGGKPDDHQANHFCQKAQTTSNQS